MRTTLDIDADVLQAAKEISRRTRLTAGKVLSDLARKSLTSAAAGQGTAITINGFEILPAGDRVVTPERVRELIDEAECS